MFIDSLIEEAVQDIHQHTFANGLTLLAERMPHVRSAALNFLVPAGCAHDPAAHPGTASVLADLITRGAGKRDSRELSLALDNLGVDRHESVGVMHVRFWGGTLARNLPQALELYADILRRPHLPEEELDPVKALAIQDILSLQDEPRQKVLIELRKRHFPPPLSNDHRGTEQGIEGLSLETVRAYYRRHFHARGTILSVAGNVEWQPLLDQVGRLFGDWPAGEDGSLRLGTVTERRAHLPKDTAQTQIAIAYPSVPIGHADYYSALGAVNVLSGGMSARLFTEVREKRGLCYAVWATYSTFKDRGSIVCYAGTTTERAQETLDVTLAELRRLGEGVLPEEVERLQAGLKSSLVMQEESTGSRAGTLASDWYYLGRVRSFDEILGAVNALTPEKIVDYVCRHPPRDPSIVTLGRQPLNLDAV